jgi:hypothetical protein
VPTAHAMVGMLRFAHPTVHPRTGSVITS